LTKQGVSRWTYREYYGSVGVRVFRQGTVTSISIAFRIFRAVCLLSVLAGEVNYIEASVEET
jgi:hypothetical protein